MTTNANAVALTKDQINAIPDEKLKSMALFLYHSSEQANKKIAEFNAGMLVDPFYTLSWSRPVFELAAQKKVADRFLAHIAEVLSGNFDKPIESCVNNLLRQANDEVQRMARNPESSSSAVSNIADRWLLAAYADVLDFVRWA